MAHQPGMGRGVGPGGTPYNFDPMHQADPHLQAHMQSPRPEHFPPTSPILTGTPTMPGPVTPSCTTPPMGTTSIPRYPLRSPTHPMYPGDQRVSPVSSRNIMDPNLPMHYQYPPFYHGRRQSYSEEPITSSPGGTHHLPAYPAGVMSQQMPNVPPYPSQNIPKRNQPVKGGTRRNPGLQVEFSPTKAVEMGHEGFLPGSSLYPPSMLRSPAYSPVPQSPALPGNASEEVKEMRRKVVEYFYQNIENLKKRYQQCLQELFFLQHGGSLVDFPLWRRRPTPQWLNYQATHKLEDEIDFFVTSNPMDSTQVQNIGNDYIALQHKFYPGNVTPGNIQPGKNLSASGSGFGNSQRAHNPHSANHVPGNPIGGNIDLASSKLFMSKDANFGPSVVRQLNKNSSSSSTQDELAAAKALAFNTSKEDIVLEAKREADILKRVSELRKEGLWSAKRLPKVQEPSRNKSHWDYVLEEMAWLATDFAQERRWKKGVAKKLSKAVLRYHQEIRTKEVKAEKESTVKLQKIASSIAKEVRQFWLNIEKVVQYKVQSRMEEKRKKALDVHLNFIVGQTEKYSSWLAESLKEAKPSTTSSVASSVASSTAASSPVSSRQDDTEEETDLNISDESDDEETIDVEESYETKEFTSAEDEISALQRESEIPIDDLLESLPLEMFAEQKTDDEGSNDVGDDGDKNDPEKGIEIRQAEDGGEPSTSAENESGKNAEVVASDGDDEFVLRDTMVDVDDEGTLDEEEKLEEKEDHAGEISQLEEEGELPIEELLKKYNVGDEFDADEVHRGDESEESVEEDSSEEDEGMEFLLQSDAAQETPSVKPNAHSESPNQELTDAAATAESLQPTGYTLETTQVKTPIPFLLRGGTLREYQYIGLDWLVTMYEKCLNGILADEMGLGKTIMTIAVLAHLACERGSWGPHLIVVPTSVMLNWEMEFKKWCPGFKILTYYGSQKERKIKRTGWTKPNAFHVCITSYKLVVQDHQSFRRKKWKYLILDEAQNIKNFKSQRWQYLLNFNTERRLLLTGTPLQNNLMELWSLMHFLMPHLFESHKDFKDWFSNPLSGMIEGSSEYNENLVKRLHKVLRPFLLRRLKSEVEKQMPQKFEHIIRCRLSKRQRVLYDDFMSQTRTKETLESGHLLSVINILMQLRKVCNHPDLFEPRPTVTSLKMTSIVYTTASLVLTALNENPLNTINFYTMNLILTELEFSLSAFARHRVRQLQTPRELITEIDNYTPPETPLLFPVKSDLHAQSQNGHVLNHAKPNGPVNFPKPSWAPGTDVKAGTPTYPEAETLCPGYAGHRYTSPSEQDDYNAFNSTENSASTYTTVGSSMFGEIRDSGFLTSLGQVAGDVKAVGNLSYTNRTLLKTSRALNASDVRMYGSMNGHVGVNSTAVLEQKKVLTEKAVEGTLNKGVGLDSSPFAMGRLDEKRFHARQHKLRFLAAVNERRCLAQPVYGHDLVQSVTVLRNPLERSWCRTSCHRPSICETLQSMTKSPQERIDEMREVTKRFVFAIPSVTCQRMEMHTCHPPPSHLTRQKHIEERLQSELSDKLHILHPIIRGQLLQFPEVRLIQYDCGKLQTLDVLLRRLKTEKHRVLIFTQMTKMLNVLERFLNYHGYLYVRLDGTTRVEQRQVLMERFNNDKKIFCFILSTRSGGVGVNLTGADTVIFYDSDWNPTMDAQAQDRCHRIGQTQDVHIYRLISEKTIEENILKKAHQKRLLGEIAIEGGNFTTTVLRESTVRDLFSINENDGDFEEMVTGDKSKEEQPARKNPKSQNAFEEVLMEAEDEQDVKAASRLKAEQDAELAEFNESIPLDDDTSNGQVSKVEEELRELESQLSGVERYAVHFVESTQNFATDEELEIDEKKLELSKKEWELGHVQTLKDEEERRAGAEDLDENLEVTYTTEESRQEFVDEVTGEEMPLWRPPTPPCDDQEDVYVDHAQNYVYESTPLPEVQLPRQTRTRRYLGEYKKHGKRSTFSFRLPYKDSVRRRLRKPHSMFDRRALEAFFKNRRNALSNAKKAKMKMTKQQQQQPQQQHPASTAIRQQSDMAMVDTGPEWFVHEDWALLQAVHYLQEMPIDLTVTDLGHTPNWLLVSDIVNTTSRTYRTARQCRDRYVNVVMTREEGKVPLIDDSQKKMKTKLKASYASPEYSAIAGNQALPKPKDGQGTRLNAVQSLDGGRSSTLHHSSLFELVKKTSVKRKPSVKQSLSTEPYPKTAGQASSTASGVKVEDVYLDPVKIVALKMERIQREKAEALRQQQQQQQQQQQPPSTQEQQQPAQQQAQPAHALSQLPATAVTKITVSQAQQPGHLSAASQQQAQAVPAYQSQRLTTHSQILTSTNQKITTAQMGTTLSAKPTANIPGTAPLQGTLVKSGSSIVVKTPTTHFPAINKRMAAHSGSPAANLPAMKTVVTSEAGGRALPPHETAVQFLASAANGSIRLTTAQLSSSNSAVVSQAQAGQRLPGKAFVHAGRTKTITASQYNSLLQQKGLLLDNMQQQQRRQQGQQPQPVQPQQQGKPVAQQAVRKVVSPAPQKHLPAGTKVDQQRLAQQTMTISRPVQQQQQLQQTATHAQQTQQLQQIIQQKQQPKQQLVQQVQQKQQASTQQQQPKQTPKQPTQLTQQPVTTQQIKRVQLASGQQVTSGIVTQAGIFTTSGVGGATKHVVKLLPGQTLQSIAHKLTPQQRILLKQQQQQRLQQQAAQRQQQSKASSQPSQTQPSTTTTVEAAPKSASPAVQSQLQATPTTQIQLVTLQQPGHTGGNNPSQPKQPATKPVTTTVAVPQMTSPSATPSSTGVSTVALTTPTSAQGAQSGNLGNQHQPHYAMRSRSQSK